MMKKIEMVEKLYERNIEIRKSFEEAEKAQEEKKIEACKKDYQELLDEVRGRGFSAMMSFYSDMKKKENSMIDIGHCYDAEKIVSMLKDFGVNEFTFSASGTQANETAFAFTKLGCSIKGMTEINDDCFNLITGRTTVPAFIFAVND